MNRNLWVASIGMMLLAWSINGYAAAEDVTVTTIAGSAGSSGSADGTGNAARFNYPCAVAVDSSGNVYVADTYNHTMRKITSAGVVTTLAGSAGNIGSADGTGSAARFWYPEGVAVDSSGNVYVGDNNNHTIRKISSSGVVTTLAGSAGNIGSADGTGSAARFYHPYQVAVDSNGNVYVTDLYNHTIRKITSAGVVTTLAGSAGNSGSADGTGSAARFNGPIGIAVDSSGNVYVGDMGNHTIRKITSAGVVTTLAGSPGISGSADGTGSAARFYVPSGVAVDTSGNVYEADYGNHTIRKVTSAGVVTTLAGSAGSSGSADGTGSAARFYNPDGVAVDMNGNIYVADTDNHTIRKIIIPLSSSLVAYYPFNGNANDESGNGHNGTVTGAALTADRYGNANSAYLFDGSGDYIDLQNTTNLNFLSGGFALSAWVCFSEYNPDRGIVGKLQRFTANGYGLNVFANKFAFYVNDDPRLTTSQTYNDGQWHNICGVYDGTNAYLYVDGSLKVTGGYTYSNPNTVPISIGDFNRGVSLNGKIDEVRIYNRALTSNEIQTLYSQTALSAPSSISASDGTYTDKVRVTWTGVSTATGYQVWRNSINDTGSAGLLAATTAVSYDDASVNANVIYYYWVKATNATSTSGFSASDSGYAFSTTSSPAISAPMGVSASDGTYTDKVAVSWTSVSAASSYEVWRATSNNTSVASNLAATVVTNYDDISAVGGVSYYYWVKAKSLTAVSVFSDPDSGYAALSAFSGYANLEVSDVILLPTTLDVGGYPGAAGLQLMNWGPNDMTTPDTRVILDFFLSKNTTFGDADDLWLGDFQTDVTLSAGSYTLLAVTATAREGFTVPSGAVGTNYVFGRARHTYPSTLGDSDESNNHAMRSGTIRVTGSGEAPSSGYHVFNDYDGDGKSDLALYRKASGDWIILLSGSGYQTATAVLGGQGYKPALADYDGDGKSDLVVYHQASGQWTFKLSASGYATASLVMGGSGYVPVPADYDGDGLADPIVYQESAGLWQILQSASSYASLNVSLGGNGYKAVAADFDGDGKSDIAVYRRSTGDWQIMLSSLEYWTTEFRFGGSGQVPAPADYDADGKTDPAVYKDLSGEWSVMMSKYSYLTATATFGGNGYVAVPADYDGDGKGDVVVYSENAGELRVLLSGSGYTQTVVPLGGPGYEPVGYYDW